MYAVRASGTRSECSPYRDDQVGDVVADHAAEPAALLAGVALEVVADVRGRGDADGDGVRVAAGVGGGRRGPP